MTSLGAGSGLLSDVDRGMPGRVNRFCLSFFANRAGVGLDANILTGRRGRDLALIPAVTLGGNLSLCNDHFIADGAVLAFGLAGCSAGSLDCQVDDLGVALGGNLGLCNDHFVANRAMLTLGLAGFGAGRLDPCVNDLGVALGWNLCLCNDDLIADGAVLALSLAGFGASRLNSRINDLGMALGRNIFLRFDNRSADRAADAIRQTRFGAGRRLAHNGLLSVAGRGNHFLRNENFVADGAVLALGLAGLGAGRLDPCVNDLGMALCTDHFALGDLLAADGADGVAGVAVLGAGGILLVDHLGERMVVLPLGVKSGVLGQINSRTIRIGGTGAVSRRIPVREVVAFTGEGVCIQRRVRLFGHGLRKHRTLDRVFRASVGLKGNCELLRLFAAPNAIDIVDGVASLGVLRFGVRAVGVVQLGSGDGDSHLTAARIILIGFGSRARCALLNVLASAIAGADIRTALGGVDGANSRYAAVYINLSVFKVCICAVVHLARRIRHGLKLAGAPDKVIAVPLIAVVNIYIFAI